MASVKVYFDLDGTLFNLYGKLDWLETIENEKPGAFKGDFLPEINLECFFNLIRKLSMYGVEFNVITWLPMQASREYEEICTTEKIAWVRENLPFINEITCQSYGIPKQNVIKKRAKTMILIDDNKEVCETWETAKMRRSFNVSKIYTVTDALQEILESIEKGLY